LSPRFFGTLGNLQVSSIDFSIAAWITLFELAGAMVGARMAHAASMTGLRRAAAASCMLTGAVMMARAL